jgi:dTDP-4-amino-4,6-dideoxygalactose transaminase
VLIDNGFAISRDELYERMRESDIYARRYFYPLISEFPMYRSLPSAHASNLPVAMQASRQVLCLPMYPDLTAGDQARIIQLIKSIAATRPAATLADAQAAATASPSSSLTFSM